MVYVNDDKNESGEGYDSDGDVEELDAIGDEMHLARMFKLMYIIDQDSNEDVEVSDRTMVNFDKELPIDMPTENIKIHCIPEDWIDSPHNVSKNEPPFASVNNPGDWSSLSFRPVFKKENGSSIYKYHCLPTGCIPVEKNDDGKRIIDGWKFFYKDWDGRRVLSGDSTVIDESSTNG